jgi:hypothetical protein
MASLVALGITIIRWANRGTPNVRTAWDFVHGKLPLVRDE